MAILRGMGWYVVGVQRVKKVGMMLEGFGEGSGHRRTYGVHCLVSGALCIARS